IREARADYKLAGRNGCKNFDPLGPAYVDGKSAQFLDISRRAYPAQQKPAIVTPLPNAKNECLEAPVGQKCALIENADRIACRPEWLLRIMRNIANHDRPLGQATKFLQTRSDTFAHRHHSVGTAYVSAFQIIDIWAEQGTPKKIVFPLAD